MAEIVVTTILAALNVVQLFFWAFLVERLVHKLMSKNYAEYSLIKNGPTVPQSPLKLPPESDLEEKEILEQLNGMIVG